MAGGVRRNVDHVEAQAEELAALAFAQTGGGLGNLLPRRPEHRPVQAGPKGIDAADMIGVVMGQ
jgi:hypothetical protein